MDVFQRKLLHHLILCKSLVRLEDFLPSFFFFLKCDKYFFSILLSNCFRHWNGYITTIEILQWILRGYRYIQEQKSCWLKTAFNYSELPFLSLGFWEQLKKIMNEYEHCMNNLTVSVPELMLFLFLFWSQTSLLI